MIITKTPLRISFFGGGTDYPIWFKENGGAVLATAIDKYIYITCRYLPPFFAHRSRIVWTLIEQVKSVTEIQHPSVRTCLEFMAVDKGVEIHYDADLPARTGLGSSSTFTVGLLNSLYALQGKMVSPEKLAKDAIYVEQQMLQENVGSQDQVLAAVGGFNLIEFLPNGDFRITPVIISAERKLNLQNHLMLFFSGFTRTASEIAGELVKKTGEKKSELRQMQLMVKDAINILNSNTDLTEFGKLLHETWLIKRSLTSQITTSVVDEIYATAKQSGAIGGKLLGAGGGGFILIFAPPDVHSQIRNKLAEFLYVPFQMEYSGSQIVFYHPEIEYASNQT